VEEARDANGDWQHDPHLDVDVVLVRQPHQPGGREIRVWGTKRPEDVDGEGHGAQLHRGECGTQVDRSPGGHGSRRPTSILSDPAGRTTSVPSSPSTTPCGGTPFMSRSKTTARSGLSGGGVKWVSTRSRTPAATASRAASAGSVW